MCGIAGIVARESSGADAGLVEAMLATIRHRGPDDSGVERPDPRVVLGNVRLAVIDLTPAGHQPMWTVDQSLCIAYNGEIYNFKALRTELERDGARFLSHSDTEVILEGYRRWGTAVCERLNGMFAFALWDAGARRLFVARDRLGKKPFYYWQRGGVFLFASEIKALLRHPAVVRAVDLRALQAYLTLGYSPAPLTMFDGVFKLPAAHQAMLEPGGDLRITRYWRAPVPGSAAEPRARLRDRVRAEVEAAVERRLVSDVPLGAFLSGGVDSTIVVGLMSRLMDQPVRTFSTAFAVGPRSFKYNVDADAARRVSRHFNTSHTEIEISDDDVRGCVYDVARQLDEPVTTPMFQTYLLARQVRQHGVTVVLSGDGSDEVFGGYSRYLRNQWLERLAHVPRPAVRAAAGVLAGTARGRGLTRALAKLDSPPLSPARYLDWWEYLDRGSRRRIVTPAVAALADYPVERLQALIDETGVSSSTDLVAYLDLLLWIAEDSNMRMDKMCMAHSLESRAPFLDYRVVEAGLSVPFARKATWRVGKQLLRDAFADLLPAEVLARPKWGWWGPIYYWMRGPLQPFVARAMEALPRTGLFDASVADLPAREPAPIVLWKLVLWAIWYDAYIEPIGLAEAA